MTTPSDHTILCIEDERDLLEEMSEELTAMGYRVMAANGGAEARQALAQRLPDLILCDIVMPDENGFELIRVIRAMPGLSATPFIFLTALTDREHELAGRHLGADDYITKPVDFDLLDVTLRAKLDLVARIRAAAFPAQPAVDGKELVHLSRRETQVLGQLARGLKIADVALALQISDHTVGQYVKAVYSKLGISSRAEATREAIRRNLLD